MYADNMTDSMRTAIDETARRRVVQDAHNKANGIEPASIIKEVRDITENVRQVAETKAPYVAAEGLPKDDLARLVRDLEAQMRTAAKDLEFEKAALLRDQVVDLRKVMVDAEVATPPAGD